MKAEALARIATLHAESGDTASAARLADEVEMTAAVTGDGWRAVALSSRAPRNRLITLGLSCGGQQESRHEVYLVDRADRRAYQQTAAFIDASDRG
jgi:hypothetical protein